MPNGIGSRLAQARLDKLPGRTKEADCVCELIGLRIDFIWVALTVWIVYWNFALSLSLSLSLLVRGQSLKLGVEVFAHPLPFNVIPHIDAFQSNGYTKAGFCSSVSAEYRILNGFQCCSQAFLITFTA